MKKILITGSSGFIGKNLIDHFNGYFNLILTTRKKRKGLYFLDLRDAINKDTLPNKIDVIIHLAQSRLYSKNNLKDIFDVNVRAIDKLLNFAKQIKVKQFINLSSGSIYNPYNGKMLETDLINPDTYYEYSKYISELLVNEYSNIFTTCNLRVFFPYGRYQNKGFLVRIIKKIYKENYFNLTDDKNIIFSPIFVDDLTKIIENVVNKKWQGTFNISSPYKYSIVDVYKIVSDNLKKNIKIEESTKSPIRIIPNINKLKNKLPNFKFLKLEETINHILNND